MEEILLAKASALKKMKRNKSIFKLGVSCFLLAAALLYLAVMIYATDDLAIGMMPQFLRNYLSGLIVYPFFASYLYCVSKEKLKFKRLFSFWNIKQLLGLVVIYTIIFVPLYAANLGFGYFYRISWNKFNILFMLLILLFIALLIEELLELTTYVYVNSHKSGLLNAIKKSLKIYFVNFFKLMLLKFSFYAWFLIPLCMSLMSDFKIFFAISPIIIVIISIFYFPYYVTSKTEYYSKLVNQ